MGVTIKQIATLANVSRGTVDKVLNNRPGVKEETKEKILKIAKELNYQPNIIGKALVQSKEPIKIGIILTPEYNPFVLEILKGIQNAQSEFSAFGVQIITKMLTTLEPAEQLSILSELVQLGVQGLAVFPLDDSQIISRLNQLIDLNIAIITFNSKVNGLNDLCFIGQNHYKGGRTSAGLMGKISGGQGKIGVIISSFNLACHQDRLAGFQDKLKDTYPQMEVVEIKENQDKKEDAFLLTMEYCNRHPDLTGIYLTGGGIAGVGSALELLGRSQNTFVICHDMVANTQELLKNGTVDFCIGQDPTQQGYMLVKTLFDYLIKKQTPPPMIEIPIHIYTDETL